MGSGLKAQNLTGIRAQRRGLRAQKNGIRDHKAFEPESGIIFITRSKNFSYHNIFPHNKVCVHRIFCPRYITYSCSRLAAVPVIRSPGCLTKTRNHILNLLLNCPGHRNMILKSLFSLCNATPQRAVNARRQRKRFIHIFFFARSREGEKGKKEILGQRKVRNYFLDLLLARVQA